MKRKRRTKLEIFFENLEKKDRTKIISHQLDLAFSGFGQGHKFRAKACWEEAVKQFMKANQK